MKKVIFLFVVSMMAFAAVSCGVKGPLYFPEQEQSQQ